MIERAPSAPRMAALRARRRREVKPYRADLDQQLVVDALVTRKLLREPRLGDDAAISPDRLRAPLSKLIDLLLRETKKK